MANTIVDPETIRSMSGTVSSVDILKGPVSYTTTVPEKVVSDSQTPGLSGSERERMEAARAVIAKAVPYEIKAKDLPWVLSEVFGKN